MTLANFTSGIIFLSAILLISCQDSQFAGESPSKKKQSSDLTPDGNDDSLDDETDEDRTDGDDSPEGGGDEGGTIGSGDDILGGEDLGNGFKSGDSVKDLHLVKSNKNKVDVFLFFDQSGSMQKFISEVSARLGTFIAKFTQSKKQLDYRILVVAKDYNLTVQNERVGHARIGIGNHNAIDVFKDLLTGKQSTGSIKLRKSSTKEFIIVSNDNSNQTAEAFATWARENRSKVGRIHVNSFIGFKSTGPLGYLGPCYIDKAGTNYIDMAKHKYLGGLAQDMCSGNWDGLIDNLGKKITEVDSNLFDLSEEPENASDIKVSINGKELSGSGWKYDADANAVEISAILSPDDKVVIAYTKK